jgi:hypothetical protein
MSFKKPHPNPLQRRGSRNRKNICRLLYNKNRNSRVIFSFVTSFPFVPFVVNFFYTKSIKGFFILKTTTKKMCLTKFTLYLILKSPS